MKETQRNATRIVPEERHLALLRYEVNQLVQTIHKEVPDLHPTLRSSADTLQAEAQKPRPERSKVLALLQQISDCTKSVRAIAHSVAAVVAISAAVLS
jgi:hypothetical protein